MKNFSPCGRPTAGWRKLNKKEAIDLYNKVLFKTFFHNPDWHEFLEHEFKWLRFEYYLYKDNFLLPLARFKVFGKEKIISLPFCEYGGPLSKWDINWGEFEKDVFSEFGNNIKIKFHPYISQPSGNLVGTPSILSSHWLKNLENTSEQEIWDSFRKTLRHEIKYAQEQNLKIKRCQNLAELKQFYNLYVANLKSKKTVPYPFPVIKYLYQNPATEVFLALHREKIIAGSLFLEYNGFVHYFLSASDYKYRNLGASYLILWTKIKSLCGQNKIFDLGASPKGSALEIFKRGWGGTEYPIYQTCLPAGRLATKRTDEKLRSSKLRNIWGLLPGFVIKKLSRYLIKYRI